jgi:hypothetical protein
MVPARSGKPEARVYVRELARFLSEPSGKLVKYAKKRGFLYRTYAYGRGIVYYVSEYGAMRLIAYIRTMQGAMHHANKPYFERREYLRLHKQRRMAKLKTEQAALNERKLLALANPGAGTEDEGCQDRPGGSQVKPEAVVGNPGGVRPTR